MGRNCGKKAWRNQVRAERKNVSQALGLLRTTPHPMGGPGESAPASDSQTPPVSLRIPVSGHGDDLTLLLTRHPVNGG